MPDTVRENIMANIATALALVTTGNGFDNTIASVQRYDASDQNEFGTVPLVIIKAGAETSEDRPNPLTTCFFDVLLGVVTRQTDADSTSTDARLNSLLGDIKKKLKEDVSRGGYAHDTTITEVMPLDNIEGQPECGLLVTVRVHYRHHQTNPKSTS